MMRTIALVASFLLAVALGVGCSSQPPSDTSVAQQTYESPEAAVDALASAVYACDRDQLRRIFGPRMNELASGDPQQDDADVQRLSAALQRGYRLADVEEGVKDVLIGPDAWLFPAPLVEDDQRWRFDTEAGIEEVMDRRVGRNELDAIATCRYVVAAQEHYYQLDPDGDGVQSYASRLPSTPGKKDGLYWPAAADEPPSPIGPVVVAALERGELKQPTADGARQPYRGYYYKILASQGAAAQGGEKSYIDSAGRMTGGFAMLAWPAEYGRTGVTSFLVGKDGVIYQADLGEGTQKAAEAIAAYDPGPIWRPVAEAAAAGAP